MDDHSQRLVFKASMSGWRAEVSGALLVNRYQKYQLAEKQMRLQPDLHWEIYSS